MSSISGMNRKNALQYKRSLKKQLVQEITNEEKQQGLRDVAILNGLKNRSKKLSWFKTEKLKMSKTGKICQLYDTHGKLCDADSHVIAETLAIFFSKVVKTINVKQDDFQNLFDYIMNKIGWHPPMAVNCYHIHTVVNDMCINQTTHKLHFSNIINQFTNIIGAVDAVCAFEKQLKNG